MPDPLTPNLLEPIDSPSIMTPAPLLKLPAPVVDYSDFDDTDKARNRIYSSVLKATRELEPISNNRHTLRLSQVEYVDPDRVSKRDQKVSLLNGLSRGRRLSGTWELLDNATQQVIDSKRSVLASVPHLTERGTFINNGTEYSLKNQHHGR